MTTPFINVNRAACDCPTSPELECGHHLTTCSAKPVLIPCPIPPTFEAVVRPGECTCDWMDGIGHAPKCPKRPIIVTCTIGGDGTWPGSEVEDGVPIVHGLVGRLQNDTRKAIIAACRSRWALVKALVLGRTDFTLLSLPLAAASSIVAQRDAVFAALADMARDEDLHEANRHALFAACPAIFPKGGVSPRPRENRPSARNLDAYVKHLIEQVGNLEGGE